MPTIGHSSTCRQKSSARQLPENQSSLMTLSVMPLVSSPLKQLWSSWCTSRCRRANASRAKRTHALSAACRVCQWQTARKIVETCSGKVFLMGEFPAENSTGKCSETVLPEEIGERAHLGRLTVEWRHRFQRLLAAHELDDPERAQARGMRLRAVREDVCRSHPAGGIPARARPGAGRSKHRSAWTRSSRPRGKNKIGCVSRL